MPFRRHAETARVRLVVFAAATLSAPLWAYACGDGTTEPPPPVPDPPRATTVTVTPATAGLAAIAATVQLSAEVRDQNGNVMAGAAVSWSSGDAAVATVDGSGLVTAAGNGTATIAATAGGVSGSAEVTVAQTVGTVTVSSAAGTLVEADTLRLLAAATDANGHAMAGAEFAWASSDTAVVVVDDSGLVTGVAAGAAVVAATSSGVSGSAELTVLAPVPTTVAVTPGTVTLMALGQTERLTAEVRDQNGRVMAGVAVAWSSGDAAVATVDGSGLVTAAGNGTATIAATAGGVSGSAEVTVAQTVGTVTVSSAAGTLVEADTLRLLAAATDANGHAVAGAEFAWASSDTAVAVVDDSGLVTGVAAGAAVVAATSSGVTGSAELTVLAPVPTAVAVTPDTVTLLALGQTAQLTAEVRDQAGRVMADVAVSWSSGDPSVAAVDSTGLVTAAGNGTATITATAGSASGTATVTVPQVYPIHLHYLNEGEPFPGFKDAAARAVTRWSRVLAPTMAVPFEIRDAWSCHVWGHTIEFTMGDILPAGLHIAVAFSGTSSTDYGIQATQCMRDVNPVTGAPVHGVIRWYPRPGFTEELRDWGTLDKVTEEIMLHEIGHVLGVGLNQRWYDNLIRIEADLFKGGSKGTDEKWEAGFAYFSTDSLVISTYERMVGKPIPSEWPGLPLQGNPVHWNGCLESPGVNGRVDIMGGWSGIKSVSLLTLSAFDGFLVDPASVEMETMSAENWWRCPRKAS